MEKIGKKETISLFTILILSHASIYGISGFVHNSGTAATINALCGLSIAIVVCLLAGNIFKSKDFTEVFLRAWGKITGYTILFLLFLATLVNAAHRMRMFSDAVGKFVLGDTPIGWIIFIAGLCIYSVALSGVESITRYSVAAFAVFFVFFAIILLSAHTEADYTNICPILGKGNFYNVFNMLYIFSDVIYMYFIFSRIKNAKPQCVVTAVLTGGIITAILTLFYTLCVPYPVSEEFAFPLYRLASLANSTVVFQRLDGLVYVLWMFSGFISSGALTLFSTMIFEKITGISDRRAVVPAVSLVVFLLVFLNPGDGINVVMSMFTFLILPITVPLYKIKERLICLKR